MRIGQRQLLYQQLAQASSLVYPSTHQYQSVAYCCLEKEGEDATYYSGGADLASTFFLLMVCSVMNFSHYYWVLVAPNIDRSVNSIVTYYVL